MNYFLSGRLERMGRKGVMGEGVFNLNGGQGFTFLEKTLSGVGRREKRGRGLLHNIVTSLTRKFYLER